MKRKTNLLLVLTALVICSGCVHTEFKSGDVAVKSDRWFWATEHYEATIPTPNGFATIKADGSKTDTDAIKAVAAGAAEGAVKGMASAH